MPEAFVILELYLDHPGEHPPKPGAETTLELFGPFKTQKAAEKWSVQAVSFPRCKHATILACDKPFDMSIKETL